MDPIALGLWRLPRQRWRRRGVVWPEITDYAAAVQVPQSAFRDPVLQEAAVATHANGMDVLASGSYSITYRVDRPDGTALAVRLFRSSTTADAVRYRRVARYISLCGDHRLRDLLCTAEFQERGIRVDGNDWPLVVMPWLGGPTLLGWLLTHHPDPASTRTLARSWRAAALALARAGVVHGDLQHGNIMVTAGLVLKLVDLDAVCVPGDRLPRPTFTPHPSYQHPAADAWWPGADVVPSLVIHLSLLAVAADPRLFETDTHNLDSLVLSHHDLTDLSAPIWSRLAESPDREVRHVAGRLRSVLAGPPPPDPSVLPELLETPNWDPTISRPPLRPAGTPAPVASHGAVADYPRFELRSWPERLAEAVLAPSGNQRRQFGVLLVSIVFVALLVSWFAARGNSGLADLTDLRASSCVVEPGAVPVTAATPSRSVHVVDCAAGYHWHLYAIVDLDTLDPAVDADHYPASSAPQLHAACTLEWSRYGTAGLVPISVLPTEAEWDDGHHDGLCFEAAADLTLVDIGPPAEPHDSAPGLDVVAADGPVQLDARRQAGDPNPDEHGQTRIQVELQITNNTGAPLDVSVGAATRIRLLVAGDVAQQVPGGEPGTEPAAFTVTVGAQPIDGRMPATGPLTATALPPDDHGYEVEIPDSPGHIYWDTDWVAQRADVGGSFGGPDAIHDTLTFAVPAAQSGDTRVLGVAYVNEALEVIGFASLAETPNGWPGAWSLPDALGDDAVPQGDLEEGDCANDADPEGHTFTTAMVEVDCADTHEWRLAATRELPDGEWPGNAEVDARASDACRVAFDEAGLDRSDLTIDRPTESKWQNGDRDVRCFQNTTTAPYPGGTIYARLEDVTLTNGTRAPATTVGQLPGGTTVSIICTARGDTYPGSAGPSDLWDYVLSPDGSGFISDTFVETGTNDPVAPSCPW